MAFGRAEFQGSVYADGRLGHPGDQYAAASLIGVTVTIAHWALKEGKRTQLALFMFFTVALGVTFLCFQAYEYGHAYSDLNLKLSTGVYGSTFFMLTGFHGFHVTLGALMLTVILARCLAAISSRKIISRSKRSRGTGTSSMSCGWACSSSCTGFREPVRRASRAAASADLPWNEAEVIAGHEQQEQRQRQSDAQRERFHGALGLAVVGHQEKQRRAQARQNRDEQEGDDDFHGAAAGSFRASVLLVKS